MSVSRGQRFTRDNPCPICGGHDGLPRGKSVRCSGFMSSNGRFAHCTREDKAGDLLINPDSGTYAHRLDGSCDCGATHSPATSRAPLPTGRAQREPDFRRCPKPYPCDYCDENGRVLYRVARWLRPSGEKTYAVFRPDGHGGWLSGRSGTRQVILLFPEVRAAVANGETVHATEGEKKVHALLALGICATCNDGGAGKWRANHTAGLRGAQRVVVWADNDEPGRKHAGQVAAALHEAGVPDIRLPILPGLAEGDGLDDWLKRRQPVEADVLRGELQRLVESTAPWKAASPAPRSANPPSANTRVSIPGGPFGKVYRSLWDGTLGQERLAREVFIFMLAHCDANGVVDMTQQAIAGRCHMPVGDVQSGVDVLEAPDSRSRSKEHQGRRIIRLAEDRDWGWRIVNYQRYRQRRAADRCADYRRRNLDEVRKRDRERKRAARRRRQ